MIDNKRSYSYSLTISTRISIHPEGRVSTYGRSYLYLGCTKTWSTLVDYIDQLGFKLKMSTFKVGRGRPSSTSTLAKSSSSSSSISSISSSSSSSWFLLESIGEKSFRDELDVGDGDRAIPFSGDTNPDPRISLAVFNPVKNTRTITSSSFRDGTWKCIL